MTTIYTSSLDNPISVRELRERISEISLRAGLRYLAVVSAQRLTGEVRHEALANTINITLLAKAFLLWGRYDGGRPLRLTGGADDEGGWLLRACNSIPWYTKADSTEDNDANVTGWLVRQAYIRHAIDDPLDAKIGRAWIMFHNLVREGSLRVPDPSGALAALLGVSAEDTWVLGMAIWANQVIHPSRDGRKWVFRPDEFVGDGPCKDEINALLRKALEKMSLTPERVRLRYEAEGSKYRDSENRDEFWNSEFNILRDFPHVALDDGTFATPYPTFALTRALDGFYFDLLEDYAQRKQAAGAKDNPYDNDINQTYGALFQRYVGRQLSLLNVTSNELVSEFQYGRKAAKKDTPDWLLLRSNQIPVLFECKARTPTLDVQRYASTSMLEAEVRAALAKACKQLARFIANVDAREEGLERLSGQQQFLCAVVMLAPLPFHMLPTIRKMIEDEAVKMEPLWKKLRERITFIPMSIRELETVVATEFTLGVPIEQQLAKYAAYREGARNVERWDGEVPIFPRHIEEYLQESYHGSKRIFNPLCQEVWNLFCDWCQRRIFGEGLEDTEREARNASTRRLAYALWEHRQHPMNDDQRDWHKAEWLLGFRVEP